jgi:hypothetical protein
MAKVGYGPKDFDPSDYRAAVRRLCSFLETLERRANYLEREADHLEREADHQEHWPATSLRGAMWEYLTGEVPEVLQDAYMVAEVGPPDFPVLPFVTQLVLQLDEMRKAIEDIESGLLPDELGVVPRWSMMDATRHLLAAWAAIVDAYPEFRGPLKLLELRSRHLPEAAPESERPATGPAPTVEAETLKGLSESEKRVAEEMRMALDFLRQQSETEEHEFGRPTYEVMYRALEELLADKGEKPSQTAETWRRYASKVRRHLDIPGRKRRA